LTGVRSLSAITLVSRKLNPGSKAPLVLKAAATLESIADKLPGMPARTSAAPLVGRAVLGSLASGIIARSLRQRILFSLLGGASAVGVTFVACSLRKLASDRGRAAGFAAGMAEDALVNAGARSLSRRVA
jgi:uncharacterized membrane protein